VNAADPVSFDRFAVSEGDSLQAGSLSVQVLATPGHTDTHLAYVVTDAAQPDQPPAVFTGGSLLYGSVRRTDLVDPARTYELTRAQFHSARRLAHSLPDEAAVFPTHGFGSFCSSGSAVGGQDSTAACLLRRLRLSCPLTTSQHTMLLAEFEYSMKPRPSFPIIDTTKERRDM